MVAWLYVRVTQPFASDGPAGSFDKLRMAWPRRHRL